MASSLNTLGGKKTGWVVVIVYSIFCLSNSMTPLVPSTS
jgi:hypothetical protein